MDYERTVVAKARAAGIEARRVPLSGAVREMPGDVDLGAVLAECKVRAAHLDARGARILSLDLDWLDKVRAEAAPRPGVVIARAKGSPRSYVLCDLDLFLALLANEKLDTGTRSNVQ